MLRGPIAMWFRSKGFSCIIQPRYDLVIIMLFNIVSKSFSLDTPYVALMYIRNKTNLYIYCTNELPVCYGQWVGPVTYCRLDYNYKTPNG